MKKFFVLAFAAILTISLSAQNQGRNNGNGPGNQGGGRMQFTPENRAEQLAKQLELTDEQKAQVTELYKKTAEQREKMRSENQGSNVDRRAQFEEMRKAEDAELEKIIGKEKMEKYLQIRAEREQRRNEIGGGGGGNRPRNNDN